MSLLEALNLPPLKAKPHVAVPSPEALRVTKHVKTMLQTIAALDAAKAPEAPRLRLALLEAAKLATHEHGVHAASARLLVLDAEIAMARAGRGKAAADAAAPKERLYTLKLGRTQLTNATQAAASKQAKIELDALEATLKRGFESHCDSLKIQREEPFAAWISGGISKVTGGQKMPELEIWDSAHDDVHKARKALKRDDIDALPALFDSISGSTERGLRAIGKFTESSIASAETAVKVLEKTKDLSSKVIVKGTERLAGKKASIAVGALYASALDGAQQLSAVHLAKMQKEVDWSEVQAKGVTEFVQGMVEELMTGALAPRFAKMFGAYLGKADFSKKALLEMGKSVGLTGPLPRDYFASAGQKFITKFLTARAVGLVKAAVDALAQSGTKNKEPKVGLEEYMHRLVEKVATDKFIDVFADFVVKHATD